MKCLVEQLFHEDGTPSGVLFIVSLGFTNKLGQKPTTLGAQNCDAFRADEHSPIEAKRVVQFGFTPLNFKFQLTIQTIRFPSHAQNMLFVI